MATIFTIWITLLPLITWQTRYEVPKVFWLLSGGIVLLVYLIFNFKKIIFLKKDYYYLSWLGVLAIAGLSSYDIRTSFLGGSYRHQGVIFFFCLLVVSKVISLFSKKEKETLYKGIAFAVLAEAVLVFSGYRLGSIGDINAVSGFIVLGIYFVYRYLPKWILILPISAMLYNFSKSATLSLLPFLFKKVNLLIIVLIIIAGFVIKPIDYSSPFENRGVIWNHSVNLIKERPLIGYGAESNEKIFKKAFYESGFPLSNLIIDRAHNLFLDITLWSGLIGLFLFVMFLCESYKTMNPDLKKVFLAFLIFSMFQPLSAAHWILLFLII